MFFPAGIPRTNTNVPGRVPHRHENFSICKAFELHAMVRKKACSSYLYGRTCPSCKGMLFQWCVNRSLLCNQSALWHGMFRELGIHKVSYRWLLLRDISIQYDVSSHVWDNTETPSWQFPLLLPINTLFSLKQKWDYQTLVTILYCIFLQTSSFRLWTIRGHRQRSCPRLVHRAYNSGMRV